MLNVSSTYFLKLSAVAYYLTGLSHGSRSKEPDMYLKRTKKLSLGLYHTQIRPHEHDIVAISCQWLDIARFGDGRHGFWLAHEEFGYGNVELNKKIYSQYKQVGIVTEDTFR